MEIETKQNKRAQLTAIQRSAIVSAHKSGASQVKIANDFGCTRKTVYNTLKRYHDENSLENREKTGRPPKLDAGACRYLCLQARRHPFWSYNQLRDATPGQPAHSTIRRILKQFGLGKRLSKMERPGKPSVARKWVRLDKYRGVKASDLGSARKSGPSVQTE
ncbi:transcriptional regulator family: Helix-turn-helix and Homeodomain-like HTH [Penicillium bovifimosum]|uniref:Transcriptional regulator family: Helix-turn-helix and Homeodomain-like HTH n=1 Tax=Penicillium bovifimosum TaxID=126998 RepID=A0A9W9GVW3_9EURO|nr:transcriptional regulator family: Helix-turn-helix and Homeodomain-like HTH [Penicillium bovifimosum]KAJ5131024.1 transcriptional regulator family: Helix-turn-helix and Homeodomain-like HTH [Penicillium bovifimosum]